MRIERLSICLLLLAAPSCVSSNAPPENLQGGLLITYEPSSGIPSCGRCETTTVTAASDGRVWVTDAYWGMGIIENWQENHQAFQLTPERFVEFRRMLEPYRPLNGEVLDIATPCKPLLNHNPYIRLTWRENGTESYSGYDMGCDNAAVERVLRAALETLGLRGDLIHPTTGLQE